MWKLGVILAVPVYHQYISPHLLNPYSPLIRETERYVEIRCDSSVRFATSLDMAILELFKPRRIERFLRKQGMKDNSYRLLIGDSTETTRMYEKSHSKPISLNDDITPRVMPNILHAIQKYGNYSFSWMGPRPRIFINDPSVARDVLSKHRAYQKTFRISNHIVRLLVEGLATLEGHEWHKSRSRLNPVFYTDKIKPMVPAIQSCCEDILNEWKKIVTKEGGSCVIDVFHHLELFTSAILSQLMFSSKYSETIKHTFLELAELAILARLPSKILHLRGEKYLPTRINRRAKEIDKSIRDVFRGMINERLEKKSRAQIENQDLLDAFLEELYEGKITKEKDQKKVIEDAIGECNIFFFSGFETSSNILTWTMIMLSIHHDWQNRARDEVFQVLGDKKDITSDDLGKLKIITMIVNEMLRLYPPVMELSRLVEEETKINGYTIPKDSLVTMPTLMFHRSTEIWGEDAGEFRPDRFAGGLTKAAKEASAYMPFGWGPRICIGMNFAIMETKTFLAMLLRNFSFDLAPTYTHAPTVAFTIQPQFGAPIILKTL